jgi:3-dehydroquinate synthase
MDAMIEARAGKPVPRIFAEDGEAAFRELERALCRELGKRDGLVVATGGGTLIDPDNRARLMEESTVVCLHARPEEISRRVKDDASRPLLAVDDPGAEIERLLSRRQEAYAALPWHVNTADLSVNRVIDRVIALARADTLPVRFPGGAYSIHIGHGLLDHVGGALRAASVPAWTRVALVSNDVVAPLYASTLIESLSTAYLRPFVCVVRDGEQHKTLESVASLYDRFLAQDLDRSGLVLSLGGGVTGDIAGFAAASFMRGVRFAQVPTTLLAMVDASVGGKTGVDLPQGKNLVGAFKQPAAVVVDPRVLSTLDAAEVRSGMAEVIKHGIIGAPGLFDELETGAPGPRSRSKGRQGARRVQHRLRLEISPKLIARALRVKIEIVEEDPYEQGRRVELNLGHTVGHAVEKLSGYELSHGDAVSIGMAAAARISGRLGRAETGLSDRIEAVLASWDLPVRLPGREPRSFRAESIWRAMAHDKKRRGDTLRWVLPTHVGEVAISDDVPKKVVLAVLRELGAA